MNARVSRFQVRFEVDGEGNVKAELESISKAAKDSAAEAKKAGDDWYEFGEKIGKGIKYAGVTAVAGIALIVRNSIQASQELAQLDAALRSTGAAAGFSREELIGMANELAANSMFSGGDVIAAQTRLLSYTNVVGETFPRALQAAIDQSARLGISVEQSAETIGKAIQLPADAMTTLARQGFYFSQEQEKLIERLEKAGRTAEAQALILDMLEESYGGAALAARNTLGGALSELIHTLEDLTTGDENGSLRGTQQAVEDLIETLNSADVRAGFGNITEAAFGTINALADFVGWANEAFAAAQRMATIQMGGFQYATGGENIANQRAEISQIRAEMERRQSSAPGQSLLTAAFQTNALPRRLIGAQGIQGSTDRELQQRLNRLEAQLQQNVDIFGDPSKPRVLFGDRDALPASFLKPEATPTRPPPAGGDDEDKKRSKKLTDEERAAQQVLAAYDRMVESYQEQSALHGDVSEAAKVRYLTEEGALAGLEPAQKALLRNLAEEADARERLAEVQEDGLRLTESLRTPQEVLNAELQRHAELLDKGAITQETYNRAVADSQEAYKRAEDAAAGHFRSMEKIVEEFSAGTQDRIGYDLYDAFSGNADRIEDRWKQMLLQLAAELAASKIMEYFNSSGSQGGASSGGGFWAGVATAIGSYFGGGGGGGLASGGYAGPGQLWEVGEGGQPELFEQNGRRFLIPGAGGNVVPAQYAAMGGVGGGGAAGMVNIEVINNGEPVNATATATTQPDGSQLIRMVLSAVADDVANGGRVGTAMKNRFDVQERI